MANKHSEYWINWINDEYQACESEIMGRSVQDMPSRRDQLAWLAEAVKMMDFKDQMLEKARAYGPRETLSGEGKLLTKEDK